MKVFVAALMSLLLLQGVALAAQINTPEFDRDTQTVTVSGSVGGADMLVSVEVLAPGHSWQELDGDVFGFDKLVYFDQTRADENGSFSFSFCLDDKTEKYSLRIFSSFDKEFCYSDNSIHTFSSKDITAVFDKVSEAKSGKDLEFLTEGSAAEFIGIDISCLSDVTDKMLFLKCVYAQMPENSIKNAADIQEAFDTGYILYQLNSANSSDELANVLEDNKVFLGLDEKYSQNLFDDESIYDSKRKSDVLSKLADTEFKNTDDFKKEYGDRILLYACCGQKNYNKIDYIIKKSEILKEYDIGKYTSLSAKARIDVLRKINGCSKPYDSVLSLAHAIKEASAPNSSGGSSIGGSGGGTSSKSEGNTNAVIYPSKQDISQSQENDKDSVHNSVSSEFKDMDGYKWANEAVSILKSAGVVSGRNDNEFCPGDDVTREEFLQMLIGAMGVSHSNTAVTFVDVNNDAWYFNCVNTGVSLGITKGISGDTFGIGTAITREDMAVMVYRALRSMNMDFTQNPAAAEFEDLSEISEYAYEPVRLLCAQAMINGTGNNRFEPKIKVNRASAAKLIYEVYKWRINHA